MSTASTDSSISEHSRHFVIKSEDLELSEPHLMVSSAGYTTLQTPHSLNLSIHSTKSYTNIQLMTTAPVLSSSYSANKQGQQHQSVYDINNLNTLSKPTKAVSHSPFSSHNTFKPKSSTSNMPSESSIALKRDVTGVHKPNRRSNSCNSLVCVNVFSILLLSYLVTLIWYLQ